VNQKPIRFQSLRVEDYSCLVRLGCLAEERAVPQEVRFTIEFRFAEAPRGVQTDEIGDTICYAKVTTLLRDHCLSDEFKLIERLAVEAFYKLHATLEPGVEMALKLQKVKPPVDGLLGGSIYTCGDFRL
jgi:dihydroneopterin aldolase